MSRFRINHGFTLIEILIVVVILGILAAMVVPQMSSAAEETQGTATVHELQKIRRHVEVYIGRNRGEVPPVEAGEGTWGPLIDDREYMKTAPANSYVGGENARVIILGEEPDTEFTRDYGWIFNVETGQVWAAGFDGLDQPLPRDN